LRVYPNLLESLAVRRLNQVWVSDITYITCGKDRFGYLAVVLDAHSRYCVGWSLQPYLDTRLTLEALQRALGKRRSPLVHHSDRGKQYASHEYTDLLKAHKVRVSMSRPGNPYDNARAESFFKTLKTEEVDLQEYASLDQARCSIREYIENRYNQRRLHSSLGYRSPKAYETAYLKHRITTLNSRKCVSP
jgi:transposase InsO family protein